MGELRPKSPVTRPETARPRSDAAAEVADAAAQVAAPSPEEVEWVSRHLATLAVHSGASAVEDPHLRALLVHAAGGGIALNYAAMPRWTAADWPAELAELTGAMRAAGEWPSLLLAERVDRPIHLDRELPGAGWTQVGHETVLWVGAASVVPHLDPSLRLEAVQPKNVEAHQLLEAQVFGLGRRGLVARGNDLGDALAGGHLRAYVVRIDGEPVAVARLSVGEHDAGLYGIGVAEAYRRRGIGTLLTTIATRAGLALGKRIVWLSVEDGNDGAAQMYQRLGFRPLFGWGRWVTRDR
jgi:ribosomal protein S18 acetylase RimI-like enzyme